MLFNLKGGQNEQGRQIVTTDSLDNVFKPLNSIPSPPSDKFWMRPETPVSMSVTNYGMGWKIGHYRGNCLLPRENRSSGFPTRSDTNRAVPAQKMTRSLKFRINEEEDPSSENKGADHFAVIAKLICAFVFAWAKIRFSHDAAQLWIGLEDKTLQG